MSRIDEALARARREFSLEDGGGDPDALRASSDGSEGVPSRELFEAPWLFPQAQRRETLPLEADGTAPATISASPSQGERSGSAGVVGQLAGFTAFEPGIVDRLVVSPEAKTGTLEQYRRLAGTLHQAQIERNVRTVMVSSALPGEGKTLTATNLALTLSESYRRKVLLIDADLRRPTLHVLFQVANLAGLSDGLMAEADERLPVIEVSKTLSLLPAGRPDPDPLSRLTSPRIRRIAEEAAAAFDWVVVDTPPIGLLTDGHILAGILDTTLLIVRAGSTPYHLIQKAVDVIGRDRIIGVVLNRAQGTSHRHYGDYYQQYDRDAGDSLQPAE